eukprot:TRINITY_DN3400_c0_g2_i1.p1 TRINITY_DN3400_c0_g2~~TRINITY_DN3400_c0_g2_i1.p1  ORF type:complete len:291 (-),score=35.56 TRINITY_DN3400_c0_g2_i1:122-994(-)
MLRFMRRSLKLPYIFLLKSTTDQITISGKRVKVEPIIKKVESLTREKKSLAFPANFYKQKLRNSYSIKYLGVTNGKIGVLTKRIPMKQPSLRYNKSLDLIASTKNKSKVIAFVKKDKTLKRNSMVKETEEAVNNLAMNTTQVKQLQKLIEGEVESGSPLIDEKMNSLNNESKISATPTGVVTKEKEHLINTYSFPNALLSQKKQKTLSESEQAFINKYSTESIASVNHMKTSSTYQQKQTGFKGKKLPSINRKFISGLRRLIERREAEIKGIGTSGKSANKLVSKYWYYI